MGRQQEWSLTACVFLFMSLTSYIDCASQKKISNHLHRLKHEPDFSIKMNMIRRLGEPAQQTTLNNKQNLKERDLITKLPGQPPVNFKQYGGYVNVDEPSGRFIYYYFVEAIKAGDSSPLVMWFNGGPGCSSLEGAYLEHGPFRVHSDGKTLYHNPYSWNNEANILYVESPVGVGFSYTNTPSYFLDLKKHGDKMTAEDNYKFLVNWLERFPEYKGREIYITGQSYAGHYAPQLAQIILHRKNQNFINLRGVLIGNPGLERQTEYEKDREFLVNHALISQGLLDLKKNICNPNISSKESAMECWSLEEKILKLTDDINLYSIYQPKCLNVTLTNKPKEYTTVTKFDPCSVYYMTAYLNTANVQEAMHANITKLPYAWNLCDQINTEWSEEDKKASILPILHELMRAGIRVLVFSGDVDAVVSVTSTMHVLQKMNLTVENIWRPWFSEGEVGGYTEEYKNNFTYATVRGAGHSVPSDQPIRALTLFSSFIHNTPLPHL